MVCENNERHSEFWRTSMTCVNHLRVSVLPALSSILDIKSAAVVMSTSSSSPSPPIEKPTWQSLGPRMVVCASITVSLSWWLHTWTRQLRNETSYIIGQWPVEYQFFPRDPYDTVERYGYGKQRVRPEHDKHAPLLPLYLLSVCVL